MTPIGEHFLASSSTLYLSDCPCPSTASTPSAWLLPMSSRLAMRASTASDMDLGADTLLDIPVGKWVHMAFVFHNQSSSSTRTRSSHPNTTSALDEEVPVQRAPFIMSVYQNGHMDVSLTYPDNAIANEHPLHFFRDMSHAGPTIVARAAHAVCTLLIVVTWLRLKFFHCSNFYYSPCTLTQLTSVCFVCRGIRTKGLCSGYSCVGLAALRPSGRCVLAWWTVRMTCVCRCVR